MLVMIEPYLPTIFIGLTGLAVLVYAILDGYDLGVGILLPKDNESQRDQMIASIGPFWDANETWLVLAVGLVLIAFPSAHSIVLKSMYIPATIMLLGLILRGISFDFRAKARVELKNTWDLVFKAGSLITSLAQGYMLGMYVMGFQGGFTTHLFAVFSAIGVVSAYCLIGSGWLIMKAEGDLQQRAINWAKKFSWICLGGVFLVSLVNPFINPGVLSKWLTFPQAFLVLPIPLLCFGFFYLCFKSLKELDTDPKKRCWLPFLCTAMIFLLCFAGIAFSFYPYIVPNQLTIWQAASATKSLMFTFVGAAIVIPVLLIYTAFSYRVFWGKLEDLKYY